MVIVISLLGIISLVACNKNKPFEYTSVYKNASSVSEYTGYQSLMSLPNGVSIVTESNGVTRGGD